MLILVMGKNNSGKSLFAERLAARLHETRYYIATMRPFGAEGAARVERHRLQREGLGFLTLELPCAIGNAPLPTGAAALLEDVPNLLSNAMFEQDGNEAEVFADIELLCRRAGHVVAVTISAFEDGDYSGETLAYIRALEALNRSLYNLADIVVEMEQGVPVCRKGELDEII
jgi:adenosylcobinamide kinase/adenosylcobinamide-phosphate guanylyltransferase